MVCVSEGDRFTYVIDKLVPGGGDHHVTKNDSAEVPVLIREKGEFNITIRNVTLELSGSDYVIEAQFTNRTHTENSVIDFSGIDFISFTDWVFYEANYQPLCRIYWIMAKLMHTS